MLNVISQSKTLKQARAEYKRRYKRSPPRGFDDWYAFAIDNNFILIDEVGVALSIFPCDLY